VIKVRSMLDVHGASVVLRLAAGAACRGTSTNPNQAERSVRKALPGKMSLPDPVCPVGPVAMLRYRYPAVDLFAPVPAPTPSFEPVPARLGVLLDDALFRVARDDLARRHPRTCETGRPSQ
jgi:hypothetical protein